MYIGVFFIMGSRYELRAKFNAIVLLELPGMDYTIDAI
jgi:hypothetical protein